MKIYIVNDNNEKPIVKSFADYETANQYTISKDLNENNIIESELKREKNCFYDVWIREGLIVFDKKIEVKVKDIKANVRIKGEIYIEQDEIGNDKSLFKKFEIFLNRKKLRKMSKLLLPYLNPNDFVVWKDNPLPENVIENGFFEAFGELEDDEVKEIYKEIKECKKNKNSLKL